MSRTRGLIGGFDKNEWVIIIGGILLLLILRHKFSDNITEAAGGY